MSGLFSFWLVLCLMFVFETLHTEALSAKQTSAKASAQDHLSRWALSQSVVVWLLCLACISTGFRVDSCVIDAFIVALLVTALALLAQFFDIFALKSTACLKSLPVDQMLPHLMEPPHNLCVDGSRFLNSDAM